MTSQKQILQNTEGGSMSSQEVSPASLFPMQENGGGQTDDRYLWPEMLRVIDEVRPTWVIGENVAGITTMVESCEITDMGGETSLFEENNGVHRFRSEHTFTIERICRDLESKGYTVQPVLIPACAVGAPHRRDRVFIIAQNSMCDGCWSRQEEEQGCQRNIGYIGTGDSKRIYREERADSSDSECKRSQERMSGGLCKNTKKERAGVDNRTKRPGNDADASDTISTGLEGQDKSRSGEGGKRMHIWRDFAGCCGTYGEGLRPEERWRNFPTVSPVHRGNDGLPFDVDNLTISFAKWRNESLKAYGNAIVPQVMYRIFQCIEQLTLFRYERK